MKEFTVCLCFGYEKCKTETEEIALRNNADAFEIVPVSAPFHKEPAYKGIILFENEE